MSFDGYSARFEGFETVEDYCRADCENPDLSDDQKRLCVQGCLLTEAEHFPAMTTFPLPDGPSRDLRERCAHAYYRLRWARDDWRHMAPVHREAYYEVADAILAEIAAAGYVIVREWVIRDGKADDRTTDGHAIPTG